MALLAMLKLWQMHRHGATPIRERVVRPAVPGKSAIRRWLVAVERRLAPASPQRQARVAAHRVQARQRRAMDPSWESTQQLAVPAQGRPHPQELDLVPQQAAAEIACVARHP